MVEKLDLIDPYERFIDEINSDPAFSQPMFSTREITAELRRAVEKEDYLVLGVFQAGAMTGLFEFLLVSEERYIEMIAGLSRSGAAYEEIAEFLRADFPGFQVDFTFNPANARIRDMLTRRGAAFFEEQLRMTLSADPPAIDINGIEPLSARYLDQYLAMHNTDCYWTGEKVADAPERFSVYLAVADGVVVGYIDMTNCYAVNEPGDVLVKEAYRGKGWGKKLMAMAIEKNRPNGMALLVDAGNTAALSLYRSVGFVQVPGKSQQTATWNVP